MLPIFPPPSSHALPASLSPTPASLPPKVEKHSHLLAAQYTLTQKGPACLMARKGGSHHPKDSPVPVISFSQCQALRQSHL